MSKHTPGPWTYTRNPEKTRFIIDSEPAHAIACTAGFEPNNEANARLIAAAPDLLFVLQSALPDLKGLALARAQDAITKATGE